MDIDEMNMRDLLTCKYIIPGFVKGKKETHLQC